jgi:nucleotide-binding universal stress UspA family protein
MATTPLIVVGVDGSEGSRLALDWALEEARMRGAAIRAVYAWMLVPTAVPELPSIFDWEALQNGARDFLETFVADTVGEDSGVEVSSVVANAPAAEALVDAARTADLLVVGSRGLGGFRGLLLGSVSNQCVQHATCPVVVVHGTREREKAPARQPAELAVR